MLEVDWFQEAKKLANMTYEGSVVELQLKQEERNKTYLKGYAILAGEIANLRAKEKKIDIVREWVAKDYKVLPTAFYVLPAKLIEELLSD